MGVLTASKNNGVNETMKMHYHSLVHLSAQQLPSLSMPSPFTGSLSSLHPWFVFFSILKAHSVEPKWFAEQKLALYSGTAGSCLLISTAGVRSSTDTSMVG